MPLCVSITANIFRTDSSSSTINTRTDSKSVATVSCCLLVSESREVLSCTPQTSSFVANAREVIQVEVLRRVRYEDFCRSPARAVSKLHARVETNRDSHASRFTSG